MKFSLRQLIFIYPDVSISSERFTASQWSYGSQPQISAAVAGTSVQAAVRMHWSRHLPSYNLRKVHAVHTLPARSYAFLQQALPAYT